MPTSNALRVILSIVLIVMGVLNNRYRMGALRHRYWNKREIRNIYEKKNSNKAGTSRGGGERWAE